MHAKIMMTAAVWLAISAIGSWAQVGGAESPPVNRPGGPGERPMGGMARRFGGPGEGRGGVGRPEKQLAAFGEDAHLVEHVPNGDARLVNGGDDREIGRAHV